MAVARFPRRASPFLWLVALAFTTLAPAPAVSQTLGTWSTAVPYGENDYALGGFVLLGEPIGVVGQFRTGIGARTDIGVQLGFPDFDRDDTLFGVAGDVKHLFFPETAEFPLDLAGVVAFGYQNASDLDLVDFDFGPVASKKMTTSGGQVLIPYSAVMFMIGHVEDDTELDVQVRLGLDYPFKAGYEFLTELNLGSRAETISISAGIAVTF
jgi:hypothetical protein